MAFTPLRRQRLNQPNGDGLDPYWVSKGLVLAWTPTYCAVPGRILSVAQTGSPKIIPGPKGLVAGYGTSSAGNTNSYISGPVLKKKAGGYRSYIGQVYALSGGGGTIGRVFQAKTGTGTDASTPTINAEAIWAQFSQNNRLQYSSLTSGGIHWNQYVQPVALVFNKWLTVGFSHNQTGNTGNANLPVGYMNGIPDGNWACVTEDNAPFIAGETDLAFGNRPSDKARTWDGYLGIQLFFDSFLSASDHAILANNPGQVFL